MSGLYRTIPRRRRSRRSVSDLGPIGACVAIFVVFILISGGCALWQSSNREIIQDVTVDSKERVCSSGNKDCKYLVFTNKGTFEITDSIIEGRFNSSDVYGRLNEGETYDFKVMGFRIPLFSTYQNIIEVDHPNGTLAPNVTPGTVAPPR